MASNSTNGTNGTMEGAHEHKAFDSSSTIPFFLDGKQVTGSKTLEVHSPVHNKLLYHAASATDEDVQAALASSEKAFKTWSRTKPAVRRDIFLRAATVFEKRRDECYKLANEETGSQENMFGFEYNLAIEACKTVAGLIMTLRGSVPTVAEEGSSAIVFQEPYGVVLAIAPWNAPYVLGLRSCLQPIAMGNTVILKGPEASPGPYWAIASVLHEAGLPPGVLNTLYHRPTDAAAITNTLVSSPIIKKINFTGSTAVGSIISSLAGKHLKPVLMELGGKAPSIVCEDAEINNAAFFCALGAFLHSGQICMSTERILVNKKIAPQFKEALTGAMDKIFQKQPAILVGAAPVEKNKKLMKDAVSKGAKVLYGDVDHDHESKTRMQPIIVEHVKPDMDIYHTESFGPTVSLIEVEDDEEAIKIANDTDYGLSSAVFTEDLRRGLRIAKEIETGAVHINSMSVHDEVALPHGGAKKSGFGRFNSTEGLLEWVRTKTVTWKD